MRKVIAKRVTADIEGDFVVFSIGMRINKPWKLHKRLPMFMAMPRMIRELERSPESGFLGHITTFGVIVQYWRSFEHLEAYARDTDRQHWPAWVDFNRRVCESRGDVGIWHETYNVRAGEYECVYSGMPPSDWRKPAERWMPEAGSSPGECPQRPPQPKLELVCHD